MKKCILFSLLISMNTQAMMVFDPTNFAKNEITAANSIVMAAKQAELLKNRIESLALEMKNSEHITDFQWRELSQLLNEIEKTSEQGQAISYTMKNLDSEFRKRYSNQTSINYQQHYQNWNTTTLTTLENSLKSIGLSMSQLKSEDSTLRAIQHQSQSATGRMQVMQISNEIAAENVRQLQSLREVVALQANAQTAHMASQTARQANQDTEFQKILDNTEIDLTEDNSPGFGKIKIR